MTLHHTRRVRRQTPLRAASMGVIALTFAACGSDGAESTSTITTEPITTDAPTESTTAVAASLPNREGSDSSSASVISREDAEQAALDAVGEGRVTWSGSEDDRGAAWEVEITRPDGSEVDVLVAADGSIVKQVAKFGSGPALEGGGTPPAEGVVSQEAAEQAALDAIGEGEVTWVGREDERGAAWEVEITRPDGSEIDVLISPDGSVIN